MSNTFLDLSVILPCRNEELAIGSCIDSIKEVFKENNIRGEIIVSDSSSDKSADISRAKGVRVVQHNKKGYGRAYLEAFKVARGKIIFLADPDGSYDFNEIPKFINYIDSGLDFVVGNRFKGNIESGAMPWLHRYIGNPLLSNFLNVLYKTKVNDVHCGMRCIRRSALLELNLKTTGMEFASEMVVQAKKNNLKIKEVAINYYPRKGESKLRSFVDGWRHLQFICLARVSKS